MANDFPQGVSNELRIERDYGNAQYSYSLILIHEKHIEKSTLWFVKGESGARIYLYMISDLISSLSTANYYDYPCLHSLRSLTVGCNNLSSPKLLA